MHRLVQSNQMNHDKPLISFNKKYDVLSLMINLSTGTIMLVHRIIRVMHKLVHRMSSRGQPHDLLFFSTYPQFGSAQR